MTQKQNTILIIEDDAQIRKMLKVFLGACNYKIEECDTAAAGVRLCSSLRPDMVLLDLGLPDMDGKEAIKMIRQWSQVPILVLTAREDDAEVVAVLNEGADDYITKPFNAEVLIARINTNLRKAAVKQAGEPEVSNGKIRVDLVRHEVLVADSKMPCTKREYDLLKYLMVNRGRMLTHKQILKEVWGPAHVDNIQYLRVYIGQLREKLTAGGCGECIVTEPGVGYRMEAA